MRGNAIHRARGQLIAQWGTSPTGDGLTGYPWKRGEGLLDPLHGKGAPLQQRRNPKVLRNRTCLGSGLSVPWQPGKRRGMALRSSTREKRGVTPYHLDGDRR